VCNRRVKGKSSPETTKLRMITISGSDNHATEYESQKFSGGCFKKTDFKYPELKSGKKFEGSREK